MQNFHIITAKYFPYTEKKGNRIRIHSARFEQTIFISALTWETAVSYLKSEGFNILGTGYIDKEIIIVTDTFEPIK